MKMTDEWFAEILARRSETQDTEFKSPCSRKEELQFARIARATLSLANHSGGGIVVVGIIEKTWELKGLTKEELATWDQENVSNLLGTYADPEVKVTVDPFRYKEKDFVILHVAEFDLLPVIAKKPGPRGNSDAQTPRVGAVYVRTLHPLGTSEVPNAYEMRALLDRAIDRGIRKRLAGHATPEAAEAAAAKKRDEARTAYGKESSEFAKLKVHGRLFERGWFDKVIRPESYRSPREVRLKDLRELASSCQVQIGGGKFPVFDRGNRIGGNNAVANELEQDDRVEAWMLNQSGQFFYRRGMRLDWMLGRHKEFSLIVGALDTICAFVIAFEIAAKLAESPLGEDRMHVEVSLYNVQGRTLVIDQGSHAWETLPPIDVESVPNRGDFDREQLKDTDKLALAWAQDTFERFNWHPPMEQLIELLRRIRLQDR